VSRKQILEKQWRKHIPKVVLATRDSARLRKRKPQSLAAFLPTRSAESWGMSKRPTDQDEAVPKCGSFEVRFPEGRPSKYFYWDDLTVRGSGRTWSRAK